MRPKNPRVPPAGLSARASDFVTYSTALYRIHRISGRHRARWDQMRTWGPVADCRWDPQPEPAGDHKAAVMYTAGDFVTAFAEVFQSTRAITLSNTLALVAWRPSRPLKLLDLTSTWAVANGASGSLDSAPRSTCRAWARTIHATWPDLDGLYVLSTLTRHPMVVEFSSARDAFPAAPDLSRPLPHPAIGPLAATAAKALAWPLRHL